MGISLIAIAMKITFNTIKPIVVIEAIGFVNSSENFMATTQPISENPDRIR
jgi:hypothetical protein